METAIEEQTTFTIQELAKNNPRAYERALDSMRGNDEFDAEYEIDYLIGEVLPQYGMASVTADEVSYDTYDGTASFGGVVGLKKLLEKVPNLSNNSLVLSELVRMEYIWPSASLTEYNGRNSFIYDFTIEENYSPDTIVEDGPFAGAECGQLFDLLDMEALSKEVVEVFKDLAGDFIKTVKDQYDYQYSEECIIENCDANEYLFDEYGELQ